MAIPEVWHHGLMAIPEQPLDTMARRARAASAIFFVAVFAAACARPDDRLGETPSLVAASVSSIAGSAGVASPRGTQTSKEDASPPPGITEADIALGHAAFSRYCGECHDGRLPTAKPKALAIFDLADEHWIGKLSPGRAEKAKGRIQGKGSEAEKRAALALLDGQLFAAARSAGSSSTTSPSLQPYF